MGKKDALATTLIAHKRAGASWAVEATAPASELREQYCARAGHGLFRLAVIVNLVF